MKGVDMKKKIDKSVKRHFGQALLVALAPIVFIQLIAYFSSNNYDTLSILLSPICVLGGCSLLLKLVLQDVYASKHEST